MSLQPPQYWGGYFNDTVTYQPLAFKAVTDGSYQISKIFTL